MRIKILPISPHVLFGPHFCYLCAQFSKNMTVFRKIWAVYAVALFLILMTLSVPVIVFNMAVKPGAPALRRNIWYLHHVFTPVFLTLIGVRLSLEGQDKLDPRQSYVIVGNHRSSLDFIVHGHSFPGVFRFLAKQELQKIPVFGWVVKKMCLTVDRSSAMSRARSVVALKQQLAEGWSIFIYPEGSRNKSDELIAPFYDGAFRIAIQTGAPVAVVTILNINDVTFGYDLQPGKVRVIWDTPIETAAMTSADIETLKNRTEEIMSGRLAENKKLLHLNY